MTGAHRALRRSSRRRRPGGPRRHRRPPPCRARRWAGAAGCPCRRGHRGRALPGHRGPGSRAGSASAWSSWPCPWAPWSWRAGRPARGSRRPRGGHAWPPPAQHHRPSWSPWRRRARGGRSGGDQGRARPARWLKARAAGARVCSPACHGPGALPHRAGLAAAAPRAVRSRLRTPRAPAVAAARARPAAGLSHHRNRLQRARRGRAPWGGSARSRAGPSYPCASIGSFGAGARGIAACAAGGELPTRRGAGRPHVAASCAC
jgi:hypothetical protein